MSTSVATKRCRKDVSPPTQSARVLIVGDHPFVRLGLSTLVGAQADLAVCGEASDVQDAIRKVGDLRPDLVLIDSTLRSGSAVELCRQLSIAQPRVKLLTVSCGERAVYAERTLLAGAAGYVSLDEAPERLLEGIRSVLKGGVFLSESLAERLLGQSAGGEDVPISRVHTLTDRELDVFQMIGHGGTNQQIAESMHIAPKTVEVYRHVLKKKLALKSGNELIRYAIQWTLVGR